MKSSKRILGETLLETLNHFLSGVEDTKKRDQEWGQLQKLRKSSSQKLELDLKEQQFREELMTQESLDFFDYVLSHERETITKVNFSAKADKIHTEVIHEAHGRLRLVKLVLEILSEGRVSRCATCKALFLKPTKRSKFCSSAHRKTNPHPKHGQKPFLN